MADSQGNDPPDLRQTFEQHGIGTMQTLLAAPDRPFVYRGHMSSAYQVREELLHWLTEQYDRAGFRSYHIAEHHSTPLGMAPSPSVFLAAVA